MNVVFWASDKPRERILAEAFLEGVRKHGDTGEVRALQPEASVAQDADVVCMVGVKSRELFQLHWRATAHTIMFDKGYTRQGTTGGVRAWEYWRTSVDAHHPTHYLHKFNCPQDRADKVGMTFKPWRKDGKHVIFAGSSAKYHDFYNLGDPTEYADKYIRRLRTRTGRKIIYRPKPSWRDAVPVSAAEFSRDGSIYDLLEDAWALVTHGSNACFEAVSMGIPCIILGDAVAKDISSTDLDMIEKPYLATDKQRRQWFNNLAYQQWNLREMASGEAWKFMRPVIYG